MSILSPFSDMCGFCKMALNRMFHDNDCSYNGINFRRNYLGGNNKFVCKDHSKCIAHERVQANHCPEGSVGIIEGLKKKVTQLQNKKKPAVQLNKKKEKDYYCLMLRKINGLDKKIQNLESLFVNYLDRDSENPICVNERSTRKFDYTDIYSAVRSLTNLTNQLKEELLNTQDGTIHCNNDDSSRLYEKIKFLETELRSLYQYWDYYQNISDSKQISENNRASLKEHKKCNNTCKFSKMEVSENERAALEEYVNNNTCNCSKIEENAENRRNTESAARNDSGNKNIKCNCKTELCNTGSEKDCFNCKIENQMFEDCKNVHCICPSCSSCSDRSCSNESLCSGNDYYHYKSREKSFCHKNDGRERNTRQNYNANTNVNKCNTKNCHQSCGICGRTVINYNLHQSNKTQKNKKYTGISDSHKLTYNDSKESEVYAQPRANYYYDNGFRRRNEDVRGMKKMKGETVSSRDKIAFKKNNNRKAVHALNDQYAKNQCRHLEHREREISFDSSNGQSYYNDRSYRSPRGRINKANHRRESYCDCIDCNEEKIKYPPKQRIFNKKSDISLQKNKNSTCPRGCKECYKKFLNNNFPKYGYNVYTVKDNVRRYGSNRENKHHNFNNKGRQRKQRFRNYHKNSEQKFEELTDSKGIESEEVSTASFKDCQRPNHNVARDHIHVTFNSEQHISNKEENKKNNQEDLIKEQPLIQTNKLKENTRPAHRNKKSTVKTKNNGVRDFQGSRGSSEDSLTSLKSADGGDNSPSQSKVYFCKDSECDNVRNKEGIIVWLNSEHNNITESVFNKIVDIVRDFNTNVCDKCIIKSQHLKVDPKNSKYANKNTKILLNKEVIRCDDCRKNLEDQISNVIDNQNRILEHNLQGDTLIIKKKVSISRNIELNSVNGRQYKSPFSQEMGQEIVVPVLQMKAKEKDPFKVHESNKNQNNELVGISNNIHKENTNADIKFSPIKSNLNDNFHSNNIQKKYSAEIVQKSMENNSIEGGNLHNKTSSNSVSEENLKHKCRPKEQNNQNPGNQSKKVAQKNGRTKFDTEKPFSPNHKDYQPHTVQSPFYSEPNSEQNILEMRNSVRQGGQNKNKKRKPKKSKTSLNSEHNSRSIFEPDVDPRTKQPIIEQVEIKSLKIDHRNKPNKQVFEKNEYTNRKRKEKIRPAQNFSDNNCKFILPVNNHFNDSSSIVTSSQEHFNNSAHYSNRNNQKYYGYNSRSKARNPLKNGVQRYSIVYPELSNEFQLNNAFYGNRGTTNNCQNIGGDAEMGSYRFKAFTISSESSFSFMDWGNVANKLKQK